MVTKPATHLTTILLAVVSLAHLARIVFATQVTLAHRVIPMWMSWVAFVVAGVLAIMLWREARTMR